MFFNNPTANFSQPIAATGAPTGPFQYDPMSDSYLGQYYACLGVTPLPDGGWSADSPLVVGSRLYYNSSLNTELSGSSGGFGDVYWYSWMDPADSTSYVYKYESDLGGITEVDLCSNYPSASNTIFWNFTIGGGTTGNFIVEKNGTQIVNVTSTSAGSFNLVLADALTCITSATSSLVANVIAGLVIDIDAYEPWTLCAASPTYTYRGPNAYASSGSITAFTQNQTGSCP